ncbi:MAG: nucleotidyltransferase domain-containing protein, partial [Oscillospiraceae bacterium]|nr:nucleotidyltransferase domain-containing protein [Oscillospiraceae bacterium]
MVYTLEQLGALIAPIAKKYGLPGVYVFGSYARGTADENSDVDLLVDTTGTALTSLISLGALYCELEETLGKSVGLVTVRSLRQLAEIPSAQDVRETVWKGKVG